MTSPPDQAAAPQPLPALDEAPPTVAPRAGCGKLLAVVLLTLVMGALILLHTHRINGPWYYTWSWRRLDAWTLFSRMALAAVPFVIGQILYVRARRPTVLAIGFVAVSVVTLQLAALSAQPPFGLSRLTLIIENTIHTSYFTAARLLADDERIGLLDWLGVFPQVLDMLQVHARFKPPGLIMYYYLLIKVIGDPHRAATIGGLLIVALSSLAVPATYRLITFFSGNRDAAFCGACYLALTPSLILFAPQFDQVYPAIACGLLLLWGLALRRGGYGYGLAFGAALAAALFLSYIFLILGLFMVVLTLLHIAERGTAGFWRAVLQALLATSVIVLFYLFLMHLGFNAVETFFMIAALQEADLVFLARPFPLHVFIDPLDFLLGAGFIAAIFVGAYVARRRRDFWPLLQQDPPTRLAFLALLQIFTVAAAALLPGEAPRLWLPMLPLLMAPVGLELTTWPTRYRMVAYACLWLILVLICQNMAFIYMGPALDGPRTL
jgi:hypothetical protein